MLAGREIAPPLTLLMCSPIGDGAALVVCSPQAAQQLGARVRVRACALVSGWDRHPGEPARSSARCRQRTRRLASGPAILTSWTRLLTA